MRNVIKVKASVMFPLIEEILDHGQNVRILVIGNSMYPFLRDCIDSVELSRAGYESLSRGDIVMVCRTDGTYVMHRLYSKKKDCFYMVGDAQQWIEGPLFPDQIVAVVSVVLRREKVISCTNLLWRFASELWLQVRPVRGFLLGAHRKVKKISWT